MTKRVQPDSSTNDNSVSNFEPQVPEGQPVSEFDATETVRENTPDTVAPTPSFLDAKPIQNVSGVAPQPVVEDAPADANSQDNTDN